MKAIVLSSLLTLLLICCSCTSKTTPRTIKKLNDSIINTFIKFQLGDDTSSLARILPLCDSIIKIDSENHRFSNILTKCQILCALGRSEEALVEGCKAYDMLPPDDVRRLMFYGFKYKLLGDSISSNKFYSSALAECEKQIANNVHSFITEKAMVLMCLGRINEAKETLQQANLVNPDDEEIIMLLEDIDSIYDKWHKANTLKEFVGLYKRD